MESSKREKAHYERLLRHGTAGRDVRLPQEQRATALLAAALGVFSRTELLRRTHKYRFGYMDENLRIPICFIRRNPLVHETDGFGLFARSDGGGGNNTLRFDAETRYAPAPTIVHPNVVSDAAPPDLRASTYEVRYLSLEELAMLAMRTLARDHMTNYQLVKTTTMAQRDAKKESCAHAELFELMADSASVSRAKWSEKAEIYFRTQRAFGTIGEPIRPFDARDTSVTCAQILHKEQFLFAKTTQNYYLVKMWSRDDDGDPSLRLRGNADGVRDSACCGNDAAKNPRLRPYDVDVEFEFGYLHMQTMREGSDAPASAVHVTSVPVDLFAPKYDDHGAVAEKDALKGTRDPSLVRSVLQRRLKAALKRFGRPVENASDMLLLFGTKKRLLRFNTLCEWCVKAFAGIPNHRAVSVALIDALHRLLDAIEVDLEYDFDRDMRREAKPRPTPRLFSQEMEQWQFEDNADRFRQHKQLLAFACTRVNSNYNHWEYSSERRGRDVAMVEPCTLGNIFYEQHFLVALRDASKSGYRDVLPLDDRADDALQSAFARCWRSLGAGGASSSEEKSDGIFGNHSLERDCTFDGLVQTPTPEVYRDGDSVVDEHGRRLLGCMLAFECEALDGTDADSGNEYRLLHAYSHRQLWANDFHVFFDALLAYVIRKPGDEGIESQRLYPGVVTYVNSSLAAHCFMKASAHIKRFVDRQHQPPQEDLKPAEGRRFVTMPEEAAQEQLAANIVLHKHLSKSFTAGAHRLNWESVASALLLNTPIARTRLMQTWSTVGTLFGHAAPFLRDMDVRYRPFSTLYDFGAHCHKVTKSERITAQRRSVPFQAVAVSVQAVAVSVQANVCETKIITYVGSALEKDFDADAAAKVRCRKRKTREGAQVSLADSVKTHHRVRKRTLTFKCT